MWRYDGPKYLSQWRRLRSKLSHVDTCCFFDDKDPSINKNRKYWKSLPKKGVKTVRPTSNLLLNMTSHLHLNLISLRGMGRDGWVDGSVQGRSCHPRQGVWVCIQGDFPKKRRHFLKQTGNAVIFRSPVSPRLFLTI